MKIFGFEIIRSKTKPVPPPPPIKDQELTGTGADEPRKFKQVAILPPVNNPTLAYKNNRTSSMSQDYERPEYNLAEIGRVEDVESYVRQAFRKKGGLMFKEGWQFVGRNAQTLKYLKKRFEQISHVTKKPMPLLLKETGMDLIKYSNAYWVKVRKLESSGGQVRRENDKSLLPVAGYFRIAPETIEVKRTKNGKVLSYRQRMPDGKRKTWTAAQVLHFYVDRKEGFLIGTPTLIPVLDDIRALRRIEENIELLIYQNLFPLFQYKVGTPEAPAEVYPDGTREIDIVKHEIQNMPSEGGIVTPERHEIKFIGSEGRALRAEGYLTHFKKRVFSGLGMSAVDFGEGETANRSTADTMSRAMVDDVKAIQREFEVFLNEFIIRELLLESTFDASAILDEENIVRMRFNEVDLDAKIKREQAALVAYEGYGITETELREEMGREPITDEQREDTFWERVAKPKALIQAVDEPYSQAAQELALNKAFATGDPERAKAEQGAEKMAKLGKAPPAGSSRGSSSAATAGTKRAKAATRPSNQQGQKLSPEKRRSAFLMDLTDNIIKAYFNLVKEDILRDVKEGKRLDTPWIRQLLLAVKSKMKEKLLVRLQQEFRGGFRDAGSNPETFNQIVFIQSTLDSRADRIIGRLIRAIQDKIEVDGHTTTDKTQHIANITAVFESLEHRTKAIFVSEINKAYWYGFALSSRAQNIPIEVDRGTNFTDCIKCEQKIGTKLDNAVYISIEDVPGFHPFCECILRQVPETNISNE